ncbi:MAG TPA: Ig-like domain repeat protein, partial [Urbifossiella sp.]|nr:Ig-like domain repeat protein [Urbifossiella sp.]
MRRSILGVFRTPARRRGWWHELDLLEDRLTPTTFTPAQIRTAYGVSTIPAFGGTTAADGTGQTIAIVDAYNNANIVADLAAFDTMYNLPAPPSFRVVNQSGGTTLPGSDPGGPGGWDLEEALDVEWAHAIAPGASLILVETNNAGTLFTGEAWAATSSGASVISNSWGGSEFGGETGEDSAFSNPHASGLPGVAFLFSAGDSGVTEYPSASPDVLSIGGTSLTVNGDNSYNSETGWFNSSNNAGGGGVSAVEGRPAYQNVTVAGTAISAVVGAHRGTPDVSMDANPNTGVAVLDTLFFPSPIDVGGTSASCPMWAGLVAIIDQGRALVGLQALNTPAESQSAPNLTSFQLQTDLYDLAANPTTYAADFHDITSGRNTTGNLAATGYDLVTGLGSPIANTLVPDMVGYTTTALAVNTASPTAFGAIQLTATVTGKTAPPTGSVDFKFGLTDLGTATISGGTATLTLASSPLPAGSDAITAFYLGDANYATSTTGKTAAVAVAASSTALSATAATLTYGQTEVLTATVSGVSGHPPTGSVDFKVGSIDLGTAPVIGGVATLSTTTLPAGAD